MSDGVVEHDLAEDVTGGEPSRTHRERRRTANTLSTIGRMPCETHRLARLASSARVPMVEPISSSCRKKSRRRSIVAMWPAVAPEQTIRPPCFADFSEWSMVGAPTVSITTSTRSGRRAPGSNAVAPSASTLARLAASRLVAYVRAPSASGQHDGGRGDAAAGALHQHRSALRQPTAYAQHPVGGQPRGGQARRLCERQLGRLRHQIGPRHSDPVGQRARDSARTGGCASGPWSRRRSASVAD